MAYRQSNSLPRLSHSAATGHDQPVVVESVLAPQFRRSASVERVHSPRGTQFQVAADFATQLPPDRLINISHTSDRDVGIVAV
jgi:hypothetical protein